MDTPSPTVGRIVTRPFLLEKKSNEDSDPFVLIFFMGSKIKLSPPQKWTQQTPNKLLLKYFSYPNN
jgi:hypothetical protein